MDPEILGGALQVALRKGWEELIESDYYKVLQDFSIFLEDTDRFEIDFRYKLPHPSHDYAAKELGRFFMQQLSDLGLIFEGYFPGDFFESSEYHKEGKPVRSFKTHLLKDGKRVYRVQIDFPHSHQGLDFHSPPIITINCA